MLRCREVEEITGLSRAGIYEQMTEGVFPKPVRIGPRAVAWVDEEVSNWQRKRIVEHDEAAANNILSPNAATVGGRSRPVVKTKIWQVAETDLPEGNREHRIFQNLFNDVGRIHVRAL